MAIQLRVAASLNKLSDELIRDLKNDKTGVFDKQWIVTQTDGINNWLKQQLALNAGIAANLEFTKVNDIVRIIYHWICPNAPFLIDKDRITWTIFAILNGEDFKNKFPSIALYYAESESRRASLANEMADLFDQYQIYRQDKIKEWNNNQINGDKDLQWQGYLWYQLKNRLGKEYSDRVDVSNSILKQLVDKENQKIVKQKLPCLRFFGLAIVTPYYLELFHLLSEFIEIKFYLLNPCPDKLWMDDLSDKKIASLRNRPDLLTLRSSGNELLINWGSVLRESYQLLLSNDNYVNNYEVIESDNFSKNNENLLGRIQYEIFNNIPNSERDLIPYEMLQDGSFQLNGCYTPVREVEVLYNYLVDVFANNLQIASRDVVVMVTNIDAYAPYIKAVFDNGPVELPYTIADESVSKGNTLFTAIRDILSVDPLTFKAEEVLSLLESPYICRRFGFKDIAVVRQAVREAGIYFGVEFENASNELYEQTEAWMVSWDYGLQKMMYGLCMSGEEEFIGTERSLFPLDTAEGSGMYDRVRLFHFIKVLKELLEQRLQKKTLQQWSEYLGKIMTEMILEEEEEDEDFPRFAYLKESIMQLDDAAAGESITYQTFHQVFISRLEQERRTNRFAGRGINFCSMLPMRSVPFKVVAILGMDFDQFPRQDTPLSFSLIGKEKRPGDRNVRENDKHLFLESILAAGEKLYISYLARDVKKGTDQPPSTLVDELLDYIALKTENVAETKKAITCIHPLHLFSVKYCESDSKLPLNYLGNSLIQGIEFEKDPQRELEVFDFSNIRLEQFAVFFQHPIKYYFNKLLGIYYREDDERIADAELFELNSLQSWQVKDELIRLNSDTDLFTIRQKKSGKLPLANFGNVKVHQMNEEIQPFKNILENIKSGYQETHLDVNYSAVNCKIEGSIPVYGNSYVYFNVSTNMLKHVMKPWINYLVAIAQESSPKLDLILLFDGIDSPFEISYSEELRDFARSIIPEFIELFKYGHSHILLFYPLMTRIFYEKDSPEFDSNELIEMYEEALENESHSKGDIFSRDEYLKQVVKQNQSTYEIFNEENIKKFNYNTILLTGELQKRLPQLFIKPTKK